MKQICINQHYDTFSVIKILIISVLLSFTTISISLSAEKEPWGGPLVTFEKADTNRDGRVDRQEYDRIIIDEFRSSDLNKDGYLNYQEMDDRERRFLLGDKKAEKEQRIEDRINEKDYLRKHYRIFEFYDLNKDNSLVPNEYRGWGL